MQTITAEEARSLSNDNNSEIQKRKKELNEALESCMVKIHNAAKVGCFRVECQCRLELLNDLTYKLNSDFGYVVSLGGYSMSWLSHREQGVQAHIVTFKVIWEEEEKLI